MAAVWWEVQTDTLCDGWVNCWTIDDQPIRFSNRIEAQDELIAYLADLDDAVKAGNMEPYDRDDFRIVQIGMCDCGCLEDLTHHRGDWECSSCGQLHNAFGQRFEPA